MPHIPSPNEHSRWAIIVREIAAGDAAGFQQLYDSLRGMRFLINRQLGESETEDVYHDTVLSLYEQIRLGNLRGAECLAGHARKIMTRKIAERMRGRTPSGEHAEGAAAETGVSDPAPDPGKVLARYKQRRIAERVLRSLPDRDREVLISFYLREQSPQEIQESMGLSDTQFRLLRTRSKARFQELCGARLSTRKGPGSAGIAGFSNSRTA